MWKLYYIYWNADTTTTINIIGTFKTVKDVWNYLGFKLKRERCGYSGMVGNKEYVLTKER